MAKTSAELEREFIETAKGQTGRSLEEWLKITKASGIGKRNDILEWLKKGHGLNHLQAQFVAGIFLNNGKPVYANQDGLLDSHFAKAPGMRAVFDAIASKVMSGFQGTQVIPKKTYLSFTAVREFIAVNVKPAEVRVGLDLGDEEFTDTVQKAKLAGPMPRFTHMIVMTQPGQLNNKILSLIGKSYDRAHKK